MDNKITSSNKKSTGISSSIRPYSLEEMADRLAIHDLYEHYVHAVDDHRLDILDHCCPR